MAKSRYILLPVFSLARPDLDQPDHGLDLGQFLLGRLIASIGREDANEGLKLEFLVAHDGVDGLGLGGNSGDTLGRAKVISVDLGLVLVGLGEGINHAKHVGLKAMPSLFRPISSDKLINAFGKGLREFENRLTLIDLGTVFLGNFYKLADFTFDCLHFCFLHSLGSCPRYAKGFVLILRG